jgi:hypothetical protein
VPLVYGDIEYLTVNAFDSTYTDWTALGASPYLGAVDTTNVIKIKAAGTHGWFDFPDTSETSINEVKAEIYCIQWDGDVNIQFDWTGDTTPETNIQTTGSTGTWYDLGVVANLDTQTKINNCRIRCVWAASKNDWIEIDAFRLVVNYTSAGDDYEFILSDTVGISDSLEDQKNIYADFSETCIITATLEDTKSIIVIQSETVTITENLDTVKGIQINLVESFYQTVVITGSLDTTVDISINLIETFYETAAIDSELYYTLPATDSNATYLTLAILAGFFGTFTFIYSLTKR